MAKCIAYKAEIKDTEEPAFYYGALDREFKTSLNMPDRLGTKDIQLIMILPNTSGKK